MTHQTIIEQERKYRDVLDAFFHKFSDQLAYLELKPGHGKIGSLDLSHVPLPVQLSGFSNRLEQWQEEIRYQDFIKGILWNLGIDPDFKYMNQYLDLIQGQVKEPDRLALFLGDETLKKELQQGKGSGEALVFYRAALLLNPSNRLARTRFGQFLWQQDFGENQDAMNRLASMELETVLNQDEENLEALVALGYLNERMGHFLKARSYYRFALSHASQPEQEEELRRSLERIQDDAAIEDAIYFIQRADYGKAMEALMEVKPVSRRYDVDYYLGLCYQNQGNYEAAAEAYQSALQRGGDFADLYNNMVYCQNLLDLPDRALQTASQGIKDHPADLRLHYNRAVLLAEKENWQEALEDVDFLLGYDDLSDEFYSQAMELRTEIQRRQAEK